MKKKIATFLIILILASASFVVFNTLFEPRFSCYGSVKELLKSPSTAKFENRRTYSSYMFWHVDSQNWFGAIGRSTYICKNWNVYDLYEENRNLDTVEREIKQTISDEVSKYINELNLDK